jgi:hypothetical protein
MNLSIVVAFHLETFFEEKEREHREPLSDAYSFVLRNSL